jgi:hypothetical protein
MADTLFAYMVGPASYPSGSDDEGDIVFKDEQYVLRIGNKVRVYLHLTEPLDFNAPLKDVDLSGAVVRAVSQSIHWWHHSYSSSESRDMLGYPPVEIEDCFGPEEIAYRYDGDAVIARAQAVVEYGFEALIRYVASEAALLYEAVERSRRKS